MKNFTIILLLSITTTFFSQNTHYNTDDGFIAEGYDVVAYFSNKTLEGKKEFTATYNGVKFKFSTKENLETFKKSPQKYMPQYGGFCAYAVAAKNIKKEIDPKTFEIRDGKLYLFYNAWFSNKLENWLEEDTPKLQIKGDENWKKLKIKKN